MLGKRDPKQIIEKKKGKRNEMGNDSTHASSRKIMVAKETRVNHGRCRALTTGGEKKRRENQWIGTKKLGKKTPREKEK